MICYNLVLLALAALCRAEPAAPVVPAALSAPALAYVAAPLVVGAQRSALATPVAARYVLEPSARTVVAYSAPSAQQQQYFARTYNGITTLALEQRDAVPVASAPLVVAPAEPAPSRYVLSEPAPARYVFSEPAPAPVPARYVFSEPASAPVPARYVLSEPAPAPAPARYVVARGQTPTPVRFLLQSPAQPVVLAAPAPAPAPAPAERVLAVTPQTAPQVTVAGPTFSSSQFFSRNYNGVPTVTYFVVGPSPVTAPVAVAPQDPGARPGQRPAPGAVPAGEPVNQGDVEVLDA